MDANKTMTTSEPSSQPEDSQQNTDEGFLEVEGHRYATPAEAKETIKRADELASLEERLRARGLCGANLIMSELFEENG